jgi:hypothetical protein
MLEIMVADLEEIRRMPWKKKVQLLALGRTTSLLMLRSLMFASTGPSSRKLKESELCPT